MMNERIQQLMIQATVREPYYPAGNDGHPEYRIYVNQEMFAELLIKECAEITSGLAKLFPRTDVAFDVGYTLGTTRATKEILKQFGLEQ
jgi:hypothetical protein